MTTSADRSAPESPPGAISDRRLIMRDERAAAAPYWGGFQARIVVTLVAFTVAWAAVILLGASGALPLSLGLVLNTLLASTFYMPLHEATHGNIAGKQRRLRRLEDIIGLFCSIPLGISYTAHRTSHMRHHAFTNDPERDPDHYTDGPLRQLPIKMLGILTLSTFLPIFAFVPAARRLLPAQLRRSMSADDDRKGGLQQLRFWVFMHLVLLLAFMLGVGWPALLLWYLPSRLQAFWLIFIFAWFPHHPATEVGRYADTRVAVFRGSRWLIRGHDHHALHHMFPRVPHYNLPRLWDDVADDLVAKGVRAEGRALGATGPIVW